MPACCARDSDWKGPSLPPRARTPHLLVLLHMVNCHRFTAGSHASCGGVAAGGGGSDGGGGKRDHGAPRRQLLRPPRVGHHHVRAGPQITEDKTERGIFICACVWFRCAVLCRASFRFHPADICVSLSWYIHKMCRAYFVFWWRLDRVPLCST